ncbi:lactonase family protein [Streptomyces sp. NPDC001443]
MNASPAPPPRAEHGPSRRTVLGAVLALSTATAAPLLSAGTAAAATCPDGDLLYIGTWNQNQVHAVRFDAADGTMTPLGAVATISSSWVTVHPHRPVLYVGGAEQGGFIRSFAIDDSTGALRQTGETETEPVPTGSGGLSYLAPTTDGDALLVADFAAGTAVTVSLTADGELGEVTSSVQDTGSGPNPRQTGPHPHHVVIDPSRRFALVADFGADRVFVYDYDAATHQLSAGPDGPASFATTPGSGPRRLVFHPDGRTVYLLSELTADLRVLDWELHQGTLTERQLLTTNAPAHTGSTSAAELALSRDGRYVYVSNRGDNALVVFSAAHGTGLLTEIQRVPCAGITPWTMTLHPGGRWLFVANEASSTLNLFGVEPHSGLLTDTGTSVAVPNPASISLRHAHAGTAGATHF